MSSPKLLTPAASNPKTAKGHALPYEAVILMLAPSDRSGVTNVCGDESDGCREACLNTAGHGGIGGPDNVVQRARIRKTRFFHEDRPGFLAQLIRELHNLRQRAWKKGLRPVCRLNGTSDIGWHRIPVTHDGVTYPSIMALFPDIIFYDYTKHPERILRALPANYVLTFSLSENNDRHAVRALAAGINVAAVLNLKDSDPMPAWFAGYPVLDGTTHDFRFLDSMGGHIVGLRPKGKAKHDGSGFVRNVEAGFDVTREPLSYLQRLARERRAA